MIAQVDMEESNVGRPRNLRITVDDTPAGYGHRARCGGGNGNGNPGNSSGWTDMFHGGMTLGVGDTTNG